MSDSSESYEWTGKRDDPSPPCRRRHTWRRDKFTTPTGCCGVLADVARDVKARRLDPKSANAIVYAVSVLLNALQGAEVERRIAALEQRATEVRQ